LLFSKVTMVLCWPGILFFGTRGILARGAPLAVLLVAVLVLNLAEIGIADRVLDLQFRSTSGNFWFLLSVVAGNSVLSLEIKQLSMLSLGCALTLLSVLFLVGRVSRDLKGFDSSAAMVASVNLIFMMLAYKTWPWYYPAFLLLALHTLLRDEERSVAKLIPLVLLGSVATLEPRLWISIRGTSPDLGSWVAATLFSLDVVVLVGVLYWTILCVRRALGDGFPVDVEPGPAEV
jgi:hypothetical protein